MEKVRAVLFSRLIRYLGYLQGVKDFKKIVTGSSIFYKKNDQTFLGEKFTENLRKLINNFFCILLTLN